MQVRLHQISKNEPRILKVKYEDFTSEPQLEIKRMPKFRSLTFYNNISEYLQSNPIVPRNMPDDSYIDTELLRQINELMNQRTEG